MFETRSVITIPIGKKLPAKRGEKGEREKGGAHTRFEKRPRYWTNEKWPDVMRKQERKTPTAGGHRSS